MAVPLALLAQLGISAYQGYKASQTNAERPTYETPQALKDLVATTNQEANAGMVPGQAQMQGRIEANTANTVGRLQQSTANSSDLVNGIGAAQVAQNRSLTDLYMSSMDYRNRARSRQMQALSTLAGVQSQAWDYNQNQPYQDAMATKSALTQSALITGTDALAGASAIGQANKDQQNKPFVPSNPANHNPNIRSIYDMPMGNGSLYSNIV